MGDSVSDNEFDIGTAGEIPVIRTFGGGKREKIRTRQTNKQPVKDSPVSLVLQQPADVHEPAIEPEPFSRAEQISEPNNELGKGPCSEGEPICELNNEPIKEPISEPVSEITNEVSVSDEYALSLVQELPKNYLEFELHELETTTHNSKATF